MAQKTDILQVRINEDIQHYLDVLEKKYRFKRCDFVRIAIIEKLQRDVPKLRKEYLKKGLSVLTKQLIIIIKLLLTV